MNEDYIDTIREARKLIALITSYTEGSEWRKHFPIMYDIFQESANKLNDTLGEHKFDWSKEHENI